MEHQNGECVFKYNPSSLVKLKSGYNPMQLSNNDTWYQALEKCPPCKMRWNAMKAEMPNKV